MALAQITWTEDRGAFLFDPDTKSTQTKPVSFCKDLSGCGLKNYRQGTMSVTINDDQSCEVVPQMIASIKVIYDASGDDTVTVAEIADALQEQLILPLIAHLTAQPACPVGDGVGGDEVGVPATPPA